MTLSLPDYTEIENALEEAESEMHVSQAHGLICGFLCGNEKKIPAWQELIVGKKDAAVANQLLEQLFDYTKNQLHSFIFDFKILLPDEDTQLSLQTEALSLFTQGFLTGLKLMNISLTKQTDLEIKETLEDLIEIAQLSHEDVVSNEENENAYVELIEYVRMAVLLIYQNRHSAQDEIKNQLH